MRQGLGCGLPNPRRFYRTQVVGLAMHAFRHALGGRGLRAFPQFDGVAASAMPATSAPVAALCLETQDGSLQAISPTSVVQRRSTPPVAACSTCSSWMDTPADRQRQGAPQTCTAFLGRTHRVPAGLTRPRTPPSCRIIRQTQPMWTGATHSAAPRRST